MEALKQITPGLTVTGGVSVADVAKLAAMGFKTVINNRPDGEEWGQAKSAAIAAAAEAQGMAYRHLPIASPMAASPAVVAQFAEALAELPGPVLAFCRSGNRSASLWALAQAGQMSADDIVATAKAGGCDLSGLRPMLGAARRG